MTTKNFQVKNGLTTGNINLWAGNGLIQTDSVTSTGNIAGGNISTAGLISAGGNIVGNNGVFNSSLSVAGNITATGNINYQNVTDLVVGDPLIYIGANNTSNLVDLGTVASANVSGVYQHLGLVRDHSDGVWKLFGNVVAEPTTVIDWGNAVFQTFQAGNLNSTGIVSATGTVTAGNLTTAGTVTLSGGSANGVGYLNSSKVLTTGSALTFDGTTLGLTNTSTAANNTTTGSFLTGGTLSFRSRGASAGIGGNTYSNQIISNNGTFVDLEMYTIGTSTNLVFGINAAEQMRLTSTGLGIGTSSPGAKLQVVGSSGSGDVQIGTSAGANQYQYITFGGSSGGTDYGWQIGRSSNTSGLGGNGAFYFYDIRANATRMSIDSSGNLGLGVTPSGWTSYTAAQIGAVGSLGSANFGGGNQQTILLNNAYHNAGFKYLTSSVASMYRQLGNEHQWHVAASGTAGSAITFTQAMTLDASQNLSIGTTSNLLSAANRVTVSVNGTSSSALAFGVGGTRTAHIYSDTAELAIANGNGASGFITFQTNGSERARIDSSGAFILGTTASINYGLLSLLVNPSANSGIALQSTSGGYDAMRFNYSDGVQKGSIAVGSTSTTYNTSSDYRLKENVKPLTGALDKLASLNPVTYNWKADGSEGEGFIAHELQEVFPQAVNGEKDAVDEDGNPVYQGIDTSFLVAALTAAVQELTARVKQLEAK